MRTNCVPRVLLLSAAILAATLFAGCPGPKPPPSPSPSPTASPTPTPVPTPVDRCAPMVCPAGEHCEDTPEEGVVCLCTIAAEPTVVVGGWVARHRDDVNFAMQRLTGCSVGSDCPLKNNETRQHFQHRVSDHLRKYLGLCAGQHTAGTDEIAVAEAPPDLLRPWEGYHIVLGDDRECPATPTEQYPPCPLRVPGKDIRKVRWISATRGYTGAYQPLTGGTH